MDRGLAPADLVTQLAHAGRRGDPGHPGPDGRAGRLVGRHRLAGAGGALRIGLPDADGLADAWLEELTEAAAAASVPFLLGGHALVSDGLRILVDAAWLGR